MAFADTIEFLLTPSMPLLFIAILLIFGAPVVLHHLLSSSNTYTTPPSVLLLGPPAAGKTSLLTLFERGGKEGAPATRTSQKSVSVELSASKDSETKSSYKNLEDASGTHTKFLLVDTPGHGKLRGVGMGKLERSEKLSAVVFVVDASALGEQEELASTASYLYDILMLLQRKASNRSASKVAIPLLIAANKTDLFTAIPSTLVRSNLEAELTRIRASKSKGLLDSGVAVDDIGSEEQDAWLGAYGSEKFSFKQMAEFDVEVEVIPGNVQGDGPGAEKWWGWIAERV